MKKVITVIAISATVLITTNLQAQGINFLTHELIMEKSAQR
ncbi:hypothetical protein OAO18_07190 [Francisellaceae bacterium]|nr:hypothetical protein [Francisellaceae bacterium]